MYFSLLKGVACVDFTMRHWQCCNFLCLFLSFSKREVERRRYFQIYWNKWRFFSSFIDVFSVWKLSGNARHVPPLDVVGMNGRQLRETKRCNEFEIKKKNWRRFRPTRSSSFFSHWGDILLRCLSFLFQKKTFFLLCGDLFFSDECLCRSTGCWVK